MIHKLCITGKFIVENRFAALNKWEAVISSSSETKEVAIFVIEWPISIICSCSALIAALDILSAPTSLKRLRISSSVKMELLLFICSVKIVGPEFLLNLVLYKKSVILIPFFYVKFYI